MDLELKNKIAFVSGSSRGRRESRRRPPRGRRARVVDGAQTGRPGPRRPGFSAGGNNDLHRRLDQTDAIRQALAEVTKNWGAPEIVVANIGTGTRANRLEAERRRVHEHVGDELFQRGPARGRGTAENDSAKARCRCFCRVSILSASKAHPRPWLTAAPRRLCSIT